MKKYILSFLISSLFVLTGCQSKPEALPSYSIKEETVHIPYAIDLGDGYEIDSSLDTYSQVLSMVSYYLKDNVEIDDNSYVFEPLAPETIEENCYYLDVSNLVNQDDPKSGLLIGEHKVTVTIANKSGQEVSEFTVFVED